MMLAGAFADYGMLKVLLLVLFASGILTSIVKDWGGSLFRTTGTAEHDAAG
jgi:hypothetical protein